LLAFIWITLLTFFPKLGYQSTKAQLLSVPPYAVAAIMTVYIGYLADRTHQRGLCNMAVSVIGIVGFALLLSGASPGVQYAGTFLGALGIYPCISNTITWVSNNTEGVYKRGVTLGFVIGWGNLNGVVSSNIYRDNDKPKYQPGHGVVLAYLILFLLGGSALQYVLLRRENVKRRAGKRDEWAAGKTEKEIEGLGDMRYVVFSIFVSHRTVKRGLFLLTNTYVWQARIYLYSLNIIMSLFSYLHWILVRLQINTLF
jgi:hypothetical protein